MKERPILFSGPMVRAILDGRKTQTRRTVKPVRRFEHHNICRPDMMADQWEVWWHGEVTDRVGVAQACPYGIPGDRLWVRECWKRGDSGLFYRADGHMDVKGWPWKPGIHMFRADSRITLEITDVRVQRLQDITEEDALAEGAKPSRSGQSGYRLEPIYTHRTGFVKVWESINGKTHSWASNPWVWSLTFKVTSPSNHERRSGESSQHVNEPNGHHDDDHHADEFQDRGVYRELRQRPQQNAQHQQHDYQLDQHGRKHTPLLPKLYSGRAE